VKPNAVTWALLGLLGQRPLSGYDLKRAVDRTIRHFWAASYGQIYPELKRLEEAGWIAGAAADRGGRARRVYEITPAGRAALAGWLHGHETRIELRDESLLRLFFADALPREQALALLEARKRGHELYLEVLGAIDAIPGKDPDFVDLVLHWGIDFNQWGADWCEKQLKRLRAKKAA
jgi:DNA-binding PadR family transcriptional regulator